MPRLVGASGIVRRKSSDHQRHRGKGIVRRGVLHEEGTIMAKAELTSEQRAALSVLANEVRAVDENAFTQLMELGEKLESQRKALKVGRGLFFGFFATQGRELGSKIKKAVDCRTFYSWVKSSNMNAALCRFIPVGVVAKICEKHKTTPPVEVLRSVVDAATIPSANDRADFMDMALEGAGLEEYVTARKTGREKNKTKNKAGAIVLAMLAGKQLNGKNAGELLATMLAGNRAALDSLKVAVELVEKSIAATPIPSQNAPAQPIPGNTELTVDAQPATADLVNQ